MDLVRKFLGRNVYDHGVPSLLDDMENYHASNFLHNTHESKQQRIRYEFEHSSHPVPEDALDCPLY